MNQREKEEYLREYAILKSAGKPFFPYAVAKDSLMGCLVVAVIITLSLVLGAELGPKTNATTTTYTPRPEWYFLSLFQMLKLFPGSQEMIGTIVVPSAILVVLMAMPLFDKIKEISTEDDAS